jgi:hypothetical protein
VKKHDELVYLLQEHMLEEMFQELERSAEATVAASERIKAALDRLKQRARKTGGE